MDLAKQVPGTGKPEGRGSPITSSPTHANLPCTLPLAVVLSTKLCFFVVQFRDLYFKVVVAIPLLWSGSSAPPSLSVIHALYVGSGLSGSHHLHSSHSVQLHEQTHTQAVRDSPPWLGLLWQPHTPWPTQAASRLSRATLYNSQGQVAPACAV